MTPLQQQQAAEFHCREVFGVGFTDVERIRAERAARQAFMAGASWYARASGRTIANLRGRIRTLSGGNHDGGNERADTIVGD